MLFKQRMAALKPRRSKDKRFRVIFMGGHHHGCAGLAALRGRFGKLAEALEAGSLRNLFHVVAVVGDRDNNAERRLFRHNAIEALRAAGYIMGGDFAEKIRKNYKNAEFRNSLGSNICDIIENSFSFEMSRIIQTARIFGFKEEEIFDESYNEELMLELVNATEAQGIVVATYGRLLSRRLIDSVGGNVFVAHPCRLLSSAGEVEDELVRRPDGKLVLPPEVRGAQVIDNIVRTIGSQAYLALIKADEGADTGEYLARTRVQGAPTFLPAELANFSQCVANTQLATAGMVDALLRHGLPPQYYTIEELQRLGVRDDRISSFAYNPDALRAHGVSLRNWQVGG